MFGEVEYCAASAYSSVAMEEQLLALEACVAAGKIRSWGVSNETAWGTCRLCELSRVLKLRPPTVLSNAYNLLCRTADISIGEVCDQEGISFLGYSPLAMGLLSGAYTLEGGSWHSSSVRRLMHYKQRYAEAESRCAFCLCPVNST